MVPLKHSRVRQYDVLMSIIREQYKFFMTVLRLVLCYKL